MDSRLEIKLSDASPKCATCSHYGGTEAAGSCSKHSIEVLNLSVCTDWAERLELEAVSK